MTKEKSIRQVCVDISRRIVVFRLSDSPVGSNVRFLRAVTVRNRMHDVSRYI
jgi:hypothetical protein